MSQHHDPVHPDSGHLTPPLLADLDEGLLDVESATHAQAHLTHCAQCQQLHRDLHDVVAALADLPEAAMPEEMWQHLRQSLEQEPAVSGAAITVVPLEAAPSRRGAWAGRTLGAVAVAAGVLFVGALIIPGLLDSTGDDSGPETAADSAGEGDLSSADDQVNLAQYAVTRSGNQYQSAQLDSQVTRLVAARSADATSSPSSGLLSGGPESSDSSAPLTDTPDETASTYNGEATTRTSLLLSPDAVRICLEQYLYAPDLEPLAIDIGRWEGKTAAIIVLPVAGNDAKIEVWVIDPSCADNPEGDVAVWHYQRLDAP